MTTDEMTPETIESMTEEEKEAIRQGVGAMLAKREVGLPQFFFEFEKDEAKMAAVLLGVAKAGDDGLHEKAIEKWLEIVSDLVVDLEVFLAVYWDILKLSSNEEGDLFFSKVPAEA